MSHVGRLVHSSCFSGHRYDSTKYSERPQKWATQYALPLFSKKAGSQSLISLCIVDLPSTLNFWGL